MAVDPNIKNKATKIRNEIYGKDVREALASGLEAMSEDVVDNKNRQDSVEGRFQDVLDGTTDKDVISAPEILDARQGHSNLGQNLLSMKQELAETNEQLAGYDQALEEYDFYLPPTASNEWIASGSGKVLDVTSEQFLDLFYDKHLGTHADGYTVTRRDEGLDASGTYPIYSYTFKPKNPVGKILLSSGMHPYELPASFGLAHLINRMMDEPDFHAILRFLRDKIQIEVIPMGL